MWVIEPLSTDFMASFQFLEIIVNDSSKIVHYVPSFKKNL